MGHVGVTTLVCILVRAETQRLRHGRVDGVVEHGENGLLVSRRRQERSLLILVNRVVDVIRGSLTVRFRLVPVDVAPFHPAPSLVVSVLEHVSAVGRHAPKVPLFVRPAAVPGQLHEALVQAQVVPDAVLPALPVFLEVGEFLYYETVYSRQSQLVARRLVERHGYESNVRVGRLLHAFLLCCVTPCLRDVIGRRGGRGSGRHQVLRKVVKVKLLGISL